ncbi:MAG TPA: TolC family protein [Bryobacteraceae bacterium]|nr:TolC family protein [Bryobacteraceae bacterium]
MSYIRNLSFSLLLVASGCCAFAQQPEVEIESPQISPFLSPLLGPFHLERRTVAPAKLENSPRLESLIRAGNLYLTAQDVIALALENNLDIAIQRYGPYLAREVLRRAEGGGLLRGVGVGISPGPVSVSLAGVDVNAVGLSESGSGVTSGGGIVSSIGTTPLNLDPYLFASASFNHFSTPLSNQRVSSVAALVTGVRSYQAGYGQSFATGTSYQLSFSSSRNSVNSPVNVVNPYTQGDLDLYMTQNLLQGWGRAVNTRYIRVAKNNMKVTDLQLRRQVVTTVSAILNLYWDLVSFDQDRRIKEQELATAQKLYDDNKRQVELGTLPAIEVTRAAAQVSASKEDLLIAQTNVAQQEIVLKNALSRTGIASASLDEVHVVPLDTIEVPPKDDLKPTANLIQEALANRPEVQQTEINVESSKINASGTRNALMPSLQAFAELTNNGLTGVANPNPAFQPAAFAVGGYGNLLGQIFRRNFPNYSAGISLNIPFRNRAPQADYVADQLSLRQSELELQKAKNQIRVDVKNAVIGLQQARARYETAVATRQLAQQTLEAEQNRFKFGESTIAAVVQAQRDLAVDQSGEIQATANYTHARIAFDEAVGQTLAVNRISMAEAESGHVARKSVIPGSQGTGNRGQGTAGGVAK